MLKHLLITRDARPLSSLAEYAKLRNLRITETSFIDTTAVPGHEIPPCQWLFFSSPRGAMAFFGAYSDQLRGDEKVAVLGPATAKVLTEQGVLCDFIGDVDASPEETAEAFAKVLGDETVLFPISQISRKSVSQLLASNQVIELVAYTTTPLHKKVDDADIYLITSPSNLEGYLLENSFPEHAEIICYGNTTDDAIQKLGLSNPTHNIHSTDEKKVIDCLESII